MRNDLFQCPGRFFLAAAIVAFGTACADDPASRIDRAREHQANAEYRAAIIELKNVLREDASNSAARAMLGEVTLLNGDSTTAIKELRRAQELGASADKYAVPLARALIREGRHEEAVKLNPDSLTESKNRATMLALVGVAELGLDNKHAAEKNFAAALELDPSQNDALIGRAKLANSRGDTAAAESVLQTMLESNPNDPEGLAELAYIQKSRGDFASAEENFNKALKGTEGLSRAHERMRYLSGLTDVLIAQNKGIQAQAAGKKMMAISDKHPMALFQSARADYSAGDFDGAIDKAGRIISVYPTAEPPRMLLAGAALASGDTALSATHLQVAVQNNPDNEAARKLLARVRLEQNDPTEALALLEPLMAAGTQDPRLLAMAGAANIKSGNQEAGLELMERGIAIGGSDPALVFQAAANFMATGELDRAIEVLESLPESERVGQRELMLVLALLKKGDVEAARAKAEAAVDDQPESAEAHSLLGSFFMAVKEYDQARNEFQKSLELNPGSLRAVVNLARIDVAEKKPEQAKARFNAVLKANPGNLLALTALAELEEADGNKDGAVALLEQAREANPDAVDPALRLGLYYLRDGSLQLAEERATQAIRAAPSNADGFNLLGQVLIQDGRHSEALGRLETAIELAPKSAVAQFHFGRALAATGREDRSFDAFQKAAGLDPKFFPALVALTEAAMQRGDFKLALATTGSLISDYPDRIEPLLLQAKVQKASNDLGGALKSYQQAGEIQLTRELAASIYQLRQSMGEKEPWAELRQWVTEHPDDTAARSMLGAAYYETGMKDLAVENFTQVMKTAPDVKVALTLAEISRSSGDPDTAVTWLQKAVALAPEEMPARSALATIELQRGNTDTAMTLVRELREDFPSAIELNVLEGDVYLAAGDYKKSLEAYETAFSVTPTEFLLLKQYQAKKGSGDDDAWKMLDKWFADHPGHLNSGLQLAQDYSEREWTDQAIKVYEKVLEAHPGSAFALNNIAWAYLKRGNDGDIRLGLAAASKAYQKEPKYAAIADTYGWILLQDGQYKRAAEILAKAASQSDSSPDIVYHHAAALNALGRDPEALALLNDLLRDDSPFESRDDAEVLQRRLSP